MSRRFTVQWTDSADHDLQSLIRYLLPENAVFAAKVFKKIRRQAGSLKYFPFRGRIVPELLVMGIDRYRERIISPYRLIYRIERKMVFVVGLFDSRRDLDEILIDRFITPE